MKLRPEFDVTWANLLNRDLIYSLDMRLGELLHEGQQMTT